MDFSYVIEKNIKLKIETYPENMTVIANNDIRLVDTQVTRSFTLTMAVQNESFERFTTINPLKLLMVE